MSRLTVERHHLEALVSWVEDSHATNHQEAFEAMKYLRSVLTIPPLSRPEIKLATADAAQH